MPFYSEDFLLSLPSSDCKWSWPRHQQSHVLQRLSFLSENWWMESWESMTLWRWPSGTEFWYDVYIYILSSRWTDRCPIPKLSTFRLAKQKKTGTFCLFSFTLQPQKKTKLPKQKKKETPPHHLTSGHSIQVQSQHSTCFSLAFLLTSTTRTPWHQIR